MKPAATSAAPVSAVSEVASQKKEEEEGVTVNHESEIWEMAGMNP